MTGKVVPVTTAFFIAALDMLNTRNGTTRKKILGNDVIVYVSGTRKRPTRYKTIMGALKQRFQFGIGGMLFILISLLGRVY
jgi:hypothetical protein